MLGRNALLPVQYCTAQATPGEASWMKEWASGELQMSRPLI